MSDYINLDMEELEELEDEVDSLIDDTLQRGCVVWDVKMLLPDGSIFRAVTPMTEASSGLAGLDFVGSAAEPAVLTLKEVLSQYISMHVPEGGAN